MMERIKLDDLNWEDANTPDQSSPKATAFVCAMMSTVLVLVGGGLYGFKLLPFQYGNEPTPTAQAATPPPIPVVKGKDTIAKLTLQEAIKSAPSAVEGMKESVVGPSKVQSLPGLQGCPDITPIAPVASAVRGWSGGNWIKPTGITLNIHAYPAGVGNDALSQLLNAKCDWLETYDVDGKIKGYVRAGTDTTEFRAWRHADVIIVITATNRPIPSAFIEDMDAKISKAITPACANVAETGDQSPRNPYYNTKEFTGLITTEQVPADGPVPEKTDQPQDKNLPDVELPQQPDFPFYPASLPQRVNKPQAPQVPSYPATTTPIKYRVSDEQGPGCGWEFTGLVPPTFDQNKSSAERAALIISVKDTMKKDFETYTQNVSTWAAQWKDYERDAAQYTTYARKVEEVSVKWSEQRQAQQDYKDAMNAYNAAVEDRESFRSRYEKARKSFEADIQTCNQYATAAPTPSVTMVQPEPTTTTVPINPEPTAPPTEALDPQATTPPAPQPTETVITVTPSPTPSTVWAQPQAPIPCPPERPSILDRQEPEVPVKPVPPPDPRPEGER